MPAVSIGGVLRLSILHGADAEQRAKLHDWLSHVSHAVLSAYGRLPLADATAVIFALLNQHFAMYLSDPSSSFARVFRRLARCVRLVFVDWRR